MSNRRKLKRPPHACDDQQETVHMHCEDCGYTDEIDLCGAGVDELLHELGIFTHTSECPACKGDGTFRVRVGREWLGEPRMVAECDNGCSPQALRAAMLRLGIDAGCIGDFGTEGERTALYRMYDTSAALLYIGITKDFGTRWKQHAESKAWYPEVQRQTVEWFDTRTAAEAAEETAIKAERPRHNIRHSGEPKPTLDDWDNLDWPTRLRLRAQLKEIMPSAFSGPPPDPE
jgi:predicted GIY-YIG superfamily endonuclease